MTTDKAGKKYWDDSWSAREVSSPVDPRMGGVRNHVRRRFHKYFRSAFSGIDTRGAKLLEVGCASSAWLPYFAKEFGFAVSGLDYSEIGCEQEREILAAAGVRGEVACADLFSPPRHMIGAFDVITSFGVVEHFEDTAACVVALSRFLRPGGTMITTVPNLAGAIGYVQKTINRPVYDMHVPLDAPTLSRAHRSAGLEVRDSRYLLSTNFGVNNLAGDQPGPLSWYAKRAALLSLIALSVGIWFLEERIGTFKANKFTSPYVACVARKPG